MKTITKYLRALIEQRAGGPAFRRNRAAQSLPIQHPTSFRRIYQTAAILALAVLPPEVCGAVATNPSPALSKRDAHKDAAGNRNRTSGGLNNVGSNGNWWTFAPNSKTNARNLNFNSTAVNPLNTNNRANGYAVLPSRALGRLPEIFQLGMKFSYNNIHRAVTTAYLKARQEERDTPAQLAFEVDLERNIKDIARELDARTWRPGPLDWFVNVTPTVREVFAPQFRDRVVSHVLFDMIAPIFERYFIYDSFSCRIGKGTLFGIKRLEHHFRSVTDNYRLPAWCLSYDITGYFMSINRARLRSIVERTLDRHASRHPDATDYDLARFIFTTYLGRDPLADCSFHGDPRRIPLVRPGKSLRGQPPGVGLPIGDVINQLFSNIYLNPLDQYLRRELHLSHSVRYVDDGKCLHRSQAYLDDCAVRIGDFLGSELGLRLHPEKTRVLDAYEGIWFLGAVVKPWRRYAQNNTVAATRDYLQSLEERLAAGADVDLGANLSRLNSRLGYLAHFQEWRAVDKMLRNSPEICARFAFTPDLSQAKLIKKS